MRLKYLDSLKGLCMIWIFYVHFLFTFHPEYGWIYNGGSRLTWLFFYGINGKIAVAGLLVLLGYFAYLSGKKKAGSLIRYSINRYWYFFFAGLLINIAYSVIGLLGGLDGKVYSVKETLLASLTLSDAIFPAYWCMLSFLLASILGYLNGKYQVSLAELVIELLVALALQQYWIAIGLLGPICFLLCQEENVAKEPKWLRWVLILLAGVIFMCMKQPESDFIYFIDALLFADLVLIISRFGFLKKLLSLKVLPFLGKHTMSIFLDHVLVYTLLAPVIFALPVSNYGLLFWANMAICFLASTVIAVPLTYFLNWACKLPNLLWKK